MLLDWTLIFLVLAIIAGYYGFYDVQTESVWIAKVLFVAFLVMYVLSFLFNRSRNEP